MRYGVKHLLLLMMAISWGLGMYQWHRANKLVRFTAQDMRGSAWQVDQGAHSHAHIAATMRVYAHWLEHAIGDRPDSDASGERVVPR